MKGVLLRRKRVLQNLPTAVRSPRYTARQPKTATRVSKTVIMNSMKMRSYSRTAPRKKRTPKITIHSTMMPSLATSSKTRSSFPLRS